MKIKRRVWRSKLSLLTVGQGATAKKRDEHEEEKIHQKIRWCGSVIKYFLIYWHLDVADDLSIYRASEILWWELSWMPSNHNFHPDSTRKTPPELSHLHLIVEWKTISSH
jgi:hypothetical protein